MGGWVIQSGADIGAITEARLHGEALQAAAERGFIEEGYAAICRSGEAQGLGDGINAPESSDMANGVVLAVRSGYVGQWEKVARDKDGR